ncbi:hypothetical protein AAMO2058_000591700 [Amorphochlora amoebiformis]|uniref:TATA-box binding protein n=1 Tax=Amorphochlora amoebiformis TaxID=1561963 RepID=A0A7S0DHT9_9EUKA
MEKKDIKELIEEFEQDMVDKEVKQVAEGGTNEVTPLETKQMEQALTRASDIFKPEVSCVFAFLHLRIPLDLIHIVTRVRGAEYNPKRFHAVVLRIREPKATAIIYASGKLVCMGARNEKAANLACRKFVRILQKVGYSEAKFAPTKAEPLIRNVMAKVKVPFPIRLEDLAVAHRDFVSFEPEIFPGLIYRMASPRVTIFVFVTGTVLVVGAKNRNQVYLAFDSIFPVLVEFKKVPEEESHTSSNISAPVTGGNNTELDPSTDARAESSGGPDQVEVFDEDEEDEEDAE